MFEPKEKLQRSVTAPSPGKRILPPLDELSHRIDDIERSFNMPRTAPAQMGQRNGLQSTSKFLIPPLSANTRSQNELLAQLLRDFHDGNSNDGIWESNDMNQGYEKALMAAKYERNLMEIFRLFNATKNLMDQGSQQELVVLEPEIKKKSKTQSLREGASNKQHRVIIRRKPIRTIMLEVQKKIQQLKNNPLEWDALEERVSSSRETRTKETNQNIVRKNIEDAWRFNPSTKIDFLHELKERNQEKIKLVLERKKYLYELFQYEKEQNQKKKEEKSLRFKKFDKDGGKLRIQQHKWFIIIVVASRLRKIQKVLEEAKREREEKFRQHTSSIIIQRAYRKHLAQNMEKRKFLAIGIISRLISVTLPRWRAHRKTMAANVIQSFFKEVYDVSKLMKVVKKYRFSVIKSQNYVRGFLTIRHAQEFVIGKYWDKLEVLWWQQKGTNDETDEKKPKTKKKKKKDEGAVHIPDESKKKAILENLLMRRKAHRAAIKQQENNLLSQRRKLISENDTNHLIEAPLVFKLLPTPAIMFGLMEQAFLESKHFT